MSGAGRLFQVGCSFSFPEASTAALINMAIGGTKAVLQLKESLESLWMLPVGEEAAAGQAAAPAKIGALGSLNVCYNICRFIFMGIYL